VSGVSSIQPVSALSAPVSEAAARAERLSALLQREFEALKCRDIDSLDHLQPEKVELLRELAALAAGVQQLPLLPDGWTAVQSVLMQCRDAHQRNARLMQLQLDAIRGALQAMQGDAAPAVELYNRIGQMSRRLHGGGEHLA
jgi:flagellar biosynthesis/type III secretory pathway chaperone